MPNDPVPRHAYLPWYRRVGPWVVLAAVLMLVMGARFAPYVYAELAAWLPHPALLDPGMPVLARGHWVDDYFAVEELGDGVFAVGEPRYWQQNYSYLIVGGTRAVLFDSGSGTRDLSAVVKTLTALPVTVIVSHLHYDHLGGIGAFDHVAMIDLPETRHDAVGDVMRPGRYEYAGFLEGRSRPGVRVTEWWKPGTEIDLGGRTLTVFSTPGHTASSAALYEESRHALFIGDFIYPTTLYAFLPGASLSAYRATLTQLLARLPRDATLWTAHCCRWDGGIAAPRLAVSDLEALQRTLGAIEAGAAHATGFYPREYPVNDEMTLQTGFPWNNR